MNGGGLHFHVPKLAQGMNQVGSFGGEFVVHSPGGSELAGAALGRRLKREQAHDVSGVRVKYLLVGRVRRGADVSLHLRQVAEVLDVSKDHVGRGSVKRTLVVLAATPGSYVCRQTGVDDDVFLACVLADADAADHEEPVAKVKLTGQAPELGVQLWQRKGLLRDVPERQVERWA